MSVYIKNVYLWSILRGINPGKWTNENKKKASAKRRTAVMLQ